MATPVICPPPICACQGCMAGSQEIVRLVKDWDISDENWEVFKEVIANSKKESELECLLKKQLAKTKKLSRHEHFLNHDIFFGIPSGPELLFEF